MGSRRGNLPGKLTQPRKITRNRYAGQQQQPGTAMRMQTSAAPTAQHGRCQASEAAGRTREWLAVSTATCFYMVRSWHLARICGWLPARRRACLSAPLYKNNPCRRKNWCHKCTYSIWKSCRTSHTGPAQTVPARPRKGLIIGAAPPVDTGLTH